MIPQHCLLQLRINSMDPLVYQMFGLQPPWEADEAFLASESGQILLNR